MGSIWFRMRSELKWREVEVSSTFVTVGELRSLICDKLELDQKTDTVTLISETDTEPFPDSKQLPRGSRIRAIRTTLDHLDRIQSEKAAAARKDVEAEEHADGASQEGSAPEQHESEDEFGPSVFDVEAQRRYQVKQAAVSAAAQKAAQGKDETAQDEGIQSDPDEFDRPEGTPIGRAFLLLQSVSSTAENGCLSAKQTSIAPSAPLPSTQNHWIPRKASQNSLTCTVPLSKSFHLSRGAPSHHRLSAPLGHVTHLASVIQHSCLEHAYDVFFG
jgi:hypothetical protein